MKVWRGAALEREARARGQGSRQLDGSPIIGRIKTRTHGQSLSLSEAAPLRKPQVGGGAAESQTALLVRITVIGLPPRIGCDPATERASVGIPSSSPYSDRTDSLGRTPWGCGAIAAGLGLAAEKASIRRGVIGDSAADLIGQGSGINGRWIDGIEPIGVNRG